MIQKALVKPIIFLSTLLLFTGCFIDSDIKEGASFTENNQTIVFGLQSEKTKRIFNFDKIILTVNGIDRTSDTEVFNKKNYTKKPLRIVYQPIVPRVLPEGNVTVKLEIPLKNKYWKRLFRMESDVKELYLFIDTLAPSINAISPQNNATLNGALVPLLYSIEDIGSDINVSSLAIRINGKEATALGSIGKGTLTIQPNQDFLLPEGDITVSISLSDNLGNTITNVFNYKGSYDDIPPSVFMVSPNAGAIITDPLTPLVFDVHDNANGSGLVSNSVKITFTNTNETFSLALDVNNNFTYTPTQENPLAFGNIQFTITAQDAAGNAVAESLNIFVQEKDILSAIPIATPSSAYAPATIRFSPKVTTNNAIQTYYWDFTGNGSYDRSDITANSYTWQYTTPGDYNVTLKVVDANNEVIIGSTIVHILNSPPQITVESSPSNGAVPLTVNFTVTATDGDGISLYEWDFDGDGNYDYNSTITGDTAYEYTMQGVFNAVLRVTDTRGVNAIYTTPTTKVLASSEGSPSVTASATPLTGGAPLAVSFSASATDPQSKGFALYEWDFDGDGLYDYNSSSSASTSYTYMEAGTFYPRVKVTTTDGRTTFDALEVIVEQSVVLSVSTDTIDISQGETTTIHTTTAAKAQMKLVIEDENYNPVIILQDWVQRNAGSYDDIWDGMNANGDSVKEGKYYAVLLYKIGDELKRLDLRDTTGGTRYNPSRNNAPRSFAPFDNRPLKINFVLPRASEVVSFMGYSYSNTRIITFRSREPLGKGTYTDTWNAQNDEGVLITPPSGKYFMYGVWAFSLADNAIYVKSGAHISGVTATPPIYTPDSHEAEGKPATLKINFTLNKEANIELELFDAQTGVTVATRQYTELSAGNKTIEFDGKDNNGIYLHSGMYTLGVRAIDNNGYRSMMEYTVTRIYY